MYIIKAVTVSSTAIIATITANPLRTPGPSDTPIFSVVSPPTTTASAEPTAAIRPISVPPKVTVPTTATNTVTVTAANNGSPYPAFNASNYYPHQNFTTHPEHHHRNDTNMMPVIYSNCTNIVPLLYSSGNQTFNGTSNPKPSCVEIICEGRQGKNETRRPHASGVGRHGYGNSTGLGYGRPSLPVSGGLGEPYGRVDESTPAAEEGDETVGDKIANPAGQGRSSDNKAKRAIGEELSDGHVSAYVKALEKGPVE